MSNILENKKILILIIILMLLALVFLLLRLLTPSVKPAPNYYSKVGPNPDIVPTIAPDPYGNGGGLDTNSSIVKESQQNIDIIRNKLPYKDNFKSTSGVDVSVYIPGANSQSAPWELETSVEGINYLRDTSDPSYNKDKTAFLEAADRLYKWVKSNGADPSKIYFGWSNKQYIRTRIQEWLNSR